MRLSDSFTLDPVGSCVNCVLVLLNLFRDQIYSNLETSHPNYLKQDLLSHGYSKPKPKNPTTTAYL